jgi:outer membrane protein OmpA-like peptidoglycan-associated protein
MKFENKNPLVHRAQYFKYLIWILLICTSSFLPREMAGQTLSGAAFLKILPGARQQAMAGSLTGGLDETLAIFANPGATGFLREWQWSANYTEWIADIYNVSLVYGRQIRLRTPWSDRINFALAVNYQGVREFDSSRGAAPSASARDLLISASIGSPVSALSRNISLGANIKFLRSQLAQFDANALVYDVGILYRTPRFRLSKTGTGLFDYAIFSVGVAVTQLGRSINFASTDTPLPRTLRAGAALNLGSHDGLQIQLAADYRNVRDEISRLSFGAEVTNLFSPLSQNLGRLIAVRGGYNFNDNLLSKLSFGLSVRLDDYMQPSAPKNTALRFDLGVIEGSEFFSPVFRGSATHQPIRPESFEFIEPIFGSYAATDTIELAWQSSNDPDLYDEVNYYLLVVKEDSSALDQLIKKSETNEFDVLQLKEVPSFTDHIGSTEVNYLYLLAQQQSSENGLEDDKIQDNLYILVKHDSTFFVDQKLNRLNYTMIPPLDPGDYYWTVLAYDKNRHIRYAETEGSKIAHFRVKLTPDLTLNIEKKPTQNFANIIVKNNNVTSVDDSFSVVVSVFDSTEFSRIKFEPVKESEALAAIGLDFRKTTPPPLNINWKKSPKGRAIEKKTFSNMAKGESFKFKVPWDKDYPFMIAVIDPENKIPEIYEYNNTDIDTLFLYDLALTKTAIVKPLKPRILFDPVGSYQLSESAKNELRGLSLVFNSSKLLDACIKIDGHTDEQGWPNKTPKENEDKNLELSKKRIESVKKYLVDSLRIDPTRILTKAYGQSNPIYKNVKNIRSKAKRDSLHKLNRRVEIYLLRSKCSAGSLDCTNIQENCSTDTIKAVTAGGEFKYKLTITNYGPFPAFDFSLRDSIPKVITPSNYSQPIDTSQTQGNFLFWSFDSLAPLQEITITFTAKVASVLPDTLIELANSSVLMAPNDLDEDNNAVIDSVYVIGVQPLPQSLIPAPSSLPTESKQSETEQTQKMPKNPKAFELPSSPKPTPIKKPNRSRRVRGVPKLKHSDLRPGNP